MRCFFQLLPTLAFASLLVAAARQDVVPSKFATKPDGLKSTQAKPPHLLSPKEPDSLGYAIPENASTGQFVVVDTVAGKKVVNGPIRVFGFDEQGRGKKIGEMAVGTTVTLKGMRVIEKTVFYAVAFEGKTAWINGYFLAPAK